MSTYEVSKFGSSDMAVHKFAQLRRKIAGVEITVLSTLWSAGWYAGMT